MYLTIILSLFFSLLFFFQLGNKFDDSVFFQKIWNWNKVNDQGMNPHKKAENPFLILNGYPKSNHLYFFNSGRILKQSAFLYELPIMGKGYIVYKQTGDEVSYFSPQNEILWKKEINSYPKVSSTGNIILFTSGDNNQIIITNGSGHDLIKVSGRFLTDYSFSENGFVVLFSSGEYYYIDNNGKIIYQMEMTPEKNSSLLFSKSASVSKSGNCFAVHYLDGQADRITLYKKFKKKFSIKLPRIYPHRINIAVSDSCQLAVNVIDRFFITDEGGRLIVEKIKVSKEKMYNIFQPVGVINDTFIISNSSYVYFYDISGNLIQQMKYPEIPWRVFSKSTNEFFFETEKEIFQMKIMR